MFAGIRETTNTTNARLGQPGMGTFRMWPSSSPLIKIGDQPAAIAPPGQKQAEARKKSSQDEGPPREHHLFFQIWNVPYRKDECNEHDYKEHYG